MLSKKNMQNCFVFGSFTIFTVGAIGSLRLFGTTVNTTTSKTLVYGEEGLMSQKAHGTCLAPVQ